MMKIHCPTAVKSSRRAGSLALSLALPVALALCIFARPYLGLPSPPEAGEYQGHQEVYDAASLGRSVPAAPLAAVDPSRVYCAWRQYKLLSDYQHGYGACLRASHSLLERRRIRDAMAEYENDYRCVYQEITPEGRRRARLPAPSL